MTQAGSAEGLLTQWSVIGYVHTADQSGPNPFFSVICDADVLFVWQCKRGKKKKIESDIEIRYVSR